MLRLISAVREAELMPHVTAAIEKCGAGRIEFTAIKNPDIVREALLSDRDQFVLLSQQMADEVLDLIGEDRPAADFAVVSGERNFDGALKAFRCGALDYFVLPDGVRELADFLLRCVSHLEKSFQHVALHRLSTVNAALRVIYDERINPATIDVLDNMYGDDFRFEYCVLCLSEQAAVTVTGAEDMLMFNDRLGQTIVIVPAEKFDSVESGLENICAGMSSVHVGLVGLHSAYHEAFSARKDAFVQNQSVVRFSIEDIVETTDFAEQELEQAIQLLAAGKPTEVAGIIQQLFSRAESGQVSADAVEWFVRTFISRARIYCGFDTMRDEFDSLENLWRYDNAAEYIAELDEVLKRYAAGTENDGEISQNKHKIQRAIEYINENYSGVLNMAIVSNHVSMNYSLFSLEFKRYTKMNFVKYLQNFRIKESMRLLVSTDHKISEISRMTGFRDDKHFMKVFKSIIGVSPSEYRRNNTPSAVSAE